VAILTWASTCRPSRQHLAVERHATPDEFRQLKDEALALGSRNVESGPLVRSSYHASNQHDLVTAPQGGQPGSRHPENWNAGSGFFHHREREAQRQGGKKVSDQDPNILVIRPLPSLCSLWFIPGPISSQSVRPRAIWSSMRVARRQIATAKEAV